MVEQHFNLITQPWIKVIDKENNEKEVSLEELFKNIADYRQLAGEMKTQDLAIMRFLLAILTSVYSRCNFDGNPYDGLEVDSDTFEVLGVTQNPREAELETWKTLYQKGHFSPVVIDYLKAYSNEFDLFDGETPFYQVTREEYDKLVPVAKTVSKGKGTVAVKQMRRTVSESNNSRSIFSPISAEEMDHVSLGELVRWLITYQNFTGVTDKTKVNSEEKFSASKGWVYSINPVFAQGKDLFDTLMLNLILGDEEQYVDQIPVWEFDRDAYIEDRLNGVIPDNRAEIYTIWSRVLHIEWKDNQPMIFTAALPGFELSGNNIEDVEPMTTWKFDKKTNTYRPESQYLGSLNKAMWRNFGHYIRVEFQTKSDQKIPGIVTWLHFLKKEKILSKDRYISLTNIAMVSDGNATSQSPAAEFIDGMRINVAVLFDDDKTRAWPVRIEDMVDLTQKVGSYYYKFAQNVATLRNLSSKSEFASEQSAIFYERFNRPFLDWLASLDIKQLQTEKLNEWKEEIGSIARDVADNLLQDTSPHDFQLKKIQVGKNKEDKENIFTYYRRFILQTHHVLAS